MKRGLALLALLAPPCLCARPGKLNPDAVKATVGLRFCEITPLK
jgi:hypothetical protein